MDSHTLQLLEFQSIRDELGEYCLSSEGKELIQQQGILTVPEDVHCLLSLVSEYRRILAGGSPFPALDFPPIRPLLRPLTKQGTVLEAEELAAVGRYILSSKRLKRFLFRNVEAPVAVGGATVAGGASALGEKAGEIPDLDGLSKEIFRTVDREGRLKESQIPELKAISRRLSGMRREVDRLVARYLSQPEYQGYWQNDRPTQRDGRMVLALKANFKGRIKGIVHELSSSGATVFIEPLDLVDKNNDIIHEQNAYRREAVRFLRALTAKAYESRAELADMVEKISFLDSLYARARYAVIHRCFPAVYRQGEIRLSEARHPLLGPGAVPIDVEIGDPTRMLIITGPNTGGKTVSLKTVGLLSLMNQFGMEIPAAEGSALGVHDNFFADIGDEQSIEQSLSTFSSHIVSLSRIVRESTSRSLVLLDELGAGTDPEEGVAIAMALLDHFIEKGSLTLATTHHGILKNYGYTRQGVQNASMEFDRTSLVPTFRMIIGIPGESHALEIAERVGMTNEITRNARSYLNDERNDISELIKRLSEKQRQLLETEKSHRERETELKEKQRNTDLLQLRLRQREMELQKQGIRELREFLETSRSRLDILIREIREGELSKDKTRRTEEFLESIREHLSREEETLKERQEEEIQDFQVTIGMPVMIRSSGRKGRILRKAKGKSWVVETDRLKITLEPEEFYPVQETERSQAVEVVAALEAGNQPAFQLDVRGLRSEEAVRQLERQIDNAVLSGLVEFSVVHGKGDGILQRQIREYLKANSAVGEFFFARPQEGGFGKTVVRLKV